MNLKQELALINGAADFRNQIFKVDDHTLPDIFSSWIVPSPWDLSPWEEEIQKRRRRITDWPQTQTYTSSNLIFSNNTYNLQTSEEDGLFTATIDMPGAKKEDVVLLAKKSQMAVSWKRGSVNHSTSVYIPDHVDHLSAKAKLESGVLTVRFQVFPQAREKVVEVE